MSRGIWLYMGARTRRSLTLLWAALFVFSIGLQYVAFAAPQSTLAVHDEGLFELDGDAVNDPAVAGDDWNQVYAGSSGAAATEFVTDPTDQKLDDIFTGGGSKDDLNVNGGPGTGWKWTIGSVPDKDNITHAYAAAYPKNGHTFVYFGADRLANNGDAFIGFWFFKGNVGPAAGGDFNGQHQVGDLLVLANFTNGGTTSTIELYEWVGSGGNTNNTLNKLGTGVVCTGAPVDDKACALTNQLEVNAPWPYSPKFGTDGKFPVESFFEGGIDLNQVFGGDAPCYSGFLAETRSSSSVDAVLKDYAFGSFDTCKPPKITTNVSTSTINVGESVTDTADLTDNSPVPTGSIDFYVCGPSASAPDCTSGGTKVGATKPLSGGTATSDAFTVSDPTKTGKYCFRAEYTPDAAGSNHYLAGKHTNTSTECFEVIPAQVTISKTALPAGPVSAGDQIGFVLSWGNSGPGTATGVVVSDSLPGDPGLDWHIIASSGSGNTCQLSGSVGAQVLTCNVGSIPGNTATHGTVTLASSTSPATCGAVDNTGRITSANDGTASASASVTVNCPDVKVTKTPDGGSVQAGDNAVFTILVENVGAGVAKGVTLTDTLPAGYTWTPVASAGSCSITAGVLSCSLGDMAPGAKITITLTAPTSAASCAVIPNTASAAATNEAAGATGNNTDSGSIDVLCATIGITKTANPAGPVSAGDTIGFDIVVANSGDGEARNVTVTDTLPTTAGTSWALVPAYTGCSIAAGVLTCNLGTVPGNTTLPAIHIQSTTSFASCGVVSNTASVSTTNDGSGSSTATVTVQCPDLSITKTADDELVNAGDQIGFTITVHNAGPGTAKAVTLSDPLPAGVTWTESPDSASCSITAGTLSCTFGDLAAGATVSVHVVAQTSGDACSVYPNTASVSATNHPSLEASATITCQAPDVTVLKTADIDPISAGEVASFTIKIWNLGPGTATNVTVSDPLPAGVTWDFVGTPPAGCSIASNTLSCTFAQLLAGEANAIEIHVSGETDLNDCHLLNNTASVTAANEPSNKTGNNASSDSILVNCPTLGITKTAVPAGPVSAGDTIGFEVMIANTGAGTAFGVSVDDPLPAGFTWSVDASSDPGWSISAGHLVFGPTSLAAGADSTALITAVTTPASCGIVNNVATIYQDQVEVAHDDASVVVDCPDVRVIKTADLPSVSAGEEIGFTIQVDNIGDGMAKGVTLSDTLPVGISGWALSPAVAGCSIVGNTLSCSFGDLVAGASRLVHVVGTTDQADCGVVPNTATVAATNEPSGATANNTSSASVTVLCATIDITKTADAPSVIAGSPIGFTVTVSNTGAGAAMNVQATDTLPTQAGLSWSIATPVTGWSIAAGKLTFSAASFAAGASSSVHIVSPTTRASCAVIDNTASVTTANDGQDQASASTTVVCPELTLQKTNDAPLVDIGGGVPPIPQVEEGDTVTFTLTYTLTDGPVTNGVLTDVLPAGLTYVTDSATNNDEFTFESYDSATRTLKWTAANVTKGGSVTYKATADAGSADLAQPLVNTATIDSAQTEPDSDTSDVYVAAPPLPVTSSPTPPPSDTIDTPQAGSPGFTLMLVLLALAGFALALGFITPVPERVRRRDR